MISYLSGQILSRDDKSIILNVRGVGYKVFLSSKRILSISKGKKEITVFCFLNSKKDPWEIYGFPSLEEKELFESLLKISGVGPKAALEASSIGSFNKIKKAIEEEEKDTMQELFSLGKKKAEAIIFEFTRKIKKSSSKVSKNDEEVIRALTKLGFLRKEIKETLLELSEEFESAEEKVRAVLKKMGK